MSLPAFGLSDSASAPPASASASSSPSVRNGRPAAALATRSNLSLALIWPSRLSAHPSGGEPPGSQSIVSGPWDSPDRNWRMNGFSELSMSSAGPASTIRPFHRTLM